MFQLTLGRVMDQQAPALRDPEYGRKLARLEARLAEVPDKPLTVILGSSRSGVGLLPGSFAGGDPAGHEEIVFNFALTGSGPVRELMTLRRLLKAGIRPGKVLIEIHPLLLHCEPGFGELAGLQASQLDWADLQLASQYVAEPEKLWVDWFRVRLAPCYSQRFCLLHRLAPAWLASSSQLSIYDHIDPWGGLAIVLPETDQAAFETRLAASVQEYAPAFDGFRIVGSPVRALRELLATCRAEDIVAALYLMPEESRFAAAYPEGAQAKIESCLVGLQQEFGCPVFDASQWCKSADFCDGHHLLASGAESFSRRFARQVLTSLNEIDSFGPGGIDSAAAAIARRQKNDSSTPLR